MALNDIVQRGVAAIKRMITPGKAQSERRRNLTLNKNIDLMLQTGTTHLKKWMPIYRDGLNYLWNNQLTKEVRKNGWDRIQENHIFPAAQQAMSLLALQKPKFLCHPEEESDVEPALQWEQILQWQFQEGLDIPSLRLNGKLDNQSYGHCVAKLHWEPEAEWDDEMGQWKGELRVKLIDPGMFLLDPNAEYPHAVENAEYAYYIREIPVEQAKQRWPQYAEEIERASDLTGADAIPDISEAIRLANMPKVEEAVGYDDAGKRGEKGVPPPDDPEGRLAGLLSHERETDVAYQQRDGRQRRTSIVVLEIYFKDYALEDRIERTPVPAQELAQQGRIMQADDGTGAMVWHDTATGNRLNGQTWPQNERKYKVPKYPHGRRVLRIGRDIILEDDAWHLPMWPLITGVNLQLPHTWHGLNSAEMARGMQDFKNIVWTNFSTYVRLHAQPRVKVEKGALMGAPDNEGVAKHLESRAGGIIKTTPGRNSGVEFEDPPQLGQSIFEILDKAEESLRDTLGMQNIALGKKQPGEQTATEALELQTNSKVRSALENMNMDIFTLDLMRKVHMFLKYYWQPGDMARIIGQAAPITIDTQLLDAHFDLKMEVGTALPFDEEREQLKADKVLQTIAQYGAVPYLLDWLKIYDVKNAEDVYAQAAEFAQQQAEAAAQQQEEAMNQEMEMKQMDNDAKLEQAKAKATAKPKPKAKGGK